VYWGRNFVSLGRGSNLMKVEVMPVMSQLADLVGLALKAG
jgi:hypothetical protein